MERMQKVSDMHKIARNKILIVCGPTASGKTKTALMLAHRFNGELVNADSRQIYKGMDVLSGKDIPFGVTPQVRAHVLVKHEKFSLVTYDIDGIPVWLYDVSPITHALSVSHFQILATHVIIDIHKRGKLPIIVGGNGFYLSSLVDSMPTLHIPQNIPLRKILDTYSVEKLQRTLLSDDASRWHAMNESDRNNPRRLIRAIEVSTWNTTYGIDPVKKTEFDAVWVGLRTATSTLAQRIAKRVSDRFDNGVIEEVKQVGALSDQLPGSSMLGLLTIRSYIHGDMSREEVCRLWTIEEIQYAKRQMVWFLKRSDIHWFNSDESETFALLEKLVHEWYT